MGPGDDRGDDDHPLPVDPDLAPADPAQPSGRRSRRPAAGAPPSGRPRQTRLRPSVLAAIAVGGAAGTCARLAVARALTSPPAGFPWATFLVNVSGSFVLGVVLVLVLERLSPARLVRPLLATGACGAYTTFSTFVTEIDLLLRAGRPGVALAYAAASLGIGLLAVVAGMEGARRLPVGAGGPARRPGDRR